MGLPKNVWTAAIMTPISDGNDTSPTTAIPKKPADLCFRSGRELANLMRARKVSAREVMTAFLQQINRVNPKINAIVAKLDDDKCLALADDADRRAASGKKLGPLHGLPFAFKDVEAAVGFPFTRGSPIYKDERPTEDAVLVERLRNAGVLPIGKTTSLSSAWARTRTTKSTGQPLIHTT